MKVSKNGLNFIANFEGFRAETYDDLQPSVKLTPNTKIKGTLTIGYGTTRWEDGSPVKIGQTITKERALELLEKQVEQHCSVFKQHIKVPLNQNQYDALASFSYNCGAYAIVNNKTMLNALNRKDWATAMNQLKLYNKSKGQVLTGLVRRREAEAKLFMTPVSSTSAQTDGKKYRVQSGAYKTQAAAQMAVNLLDKHKIANAAYAKVYIDKDVWRFITGTYSSKSDAEAALAKMKQLKILSVGYLVEA